MYLETELTNAGRALIVKSLQGVCPITFTKIGIGKGEAPIEISSLTNLTSPVLVAGIGNITAGDGIANISCVFDNASLTEDFYWKEIGVFANDPHDGEILYSYANAGDKKDHIPKYNNITALRTTLNIAVAVGDTKDFNAIISDFIGYVSTEVFEKHTSDIDNPHKVTAKQVGLENVPNVSTNDQTPTFEDSEKFENILSGDKLKIIMSKIKTAIARLISHVNASNPHKITCDTISAAKALHLHSANDINSGVLPLSHGGTGVSSISSLINTYPDLHIPKFGTYTGNGDSEKEIYLGFCPAAVFVITKDGTMSTVDDLFNGYTHGGLAFKNIPATAGNGSSVIQITTNGFKVFFSALGSVKTNKNNTVYHYIAWR